MARGSSSTRCRMVNGSLRSNGGAGGANTRWGCFPTHLKARNQKLGALGMRRNIGKLKARKTVHTV